MKKKYLYVTCSFFRVFQKYVPLNAINFSKIVAEYLFNISTLLQIFQKRFSPVKSCVKYLGHFCNFRNRLQFQEKVEIQTKIRYSQVCLQSCKNPCNKNLCSHSSRSYQDLSTDLTNFQNLEFIPVVYEKKRLPVRVVVSNLKQQSTIPFPNKQQHFCQFCLSLSQKFCLIFPTLISNSDHFKTRF